MAATMLPPADLLPDALPTDRLTATGRPVPELRKELRRIPDARNVVTVLGVYLQSFGVIAAAVVLHHPVLLGTDEQIEQVAQAVRKVQGFDWAKRR